MIGHLAKTESSSDWCLERSQLNRTLNQSQVHLSEDGGGRVAKHGELNHGEEVSDGVDPVLRHPRLTDTQTQLLELQSKLDGLEVVRGVEEDLGSHPQQII